MNVGVVATVTSSAAVYGRVAAAAVASGVEFVNDISGLSYDPQMAAVVAASGAGLIVMHARGRPDAMQQNTLLFRYILINISFFIII